jgi:type I restriction enzyme S subunit
MVMLRADPSKCDGKFLLYSLQSPAVQHEIGTNEGTGSTVSNLRIPFLKALKIKCPPLHEQKRIAGILGALDDKIELNRKMNETLEQMAKALFKSWFIDFDPVHAKAAGRQPAGMDKATADLFPDSLVDSELGKIPSGWEAGTLSGLSEFSRESINPGESPSEIFDHYSLPSFDEGKAPKAEAGSEIKSNKLVVTKTCVLLSKLNPHIPRIWLPDLSASRRSICSTEFIVASAMAGCTREYLYALFISEDFSRTYGTLVTGTTGSHQRIRAESVLQMRLPVAPTKLISSFTDTIAPMLNRVASNTKESQTLAALRDTLLPQLLNTDLKVA